MMLQSSASERLPHERMHPLWLSFRSADLEGRFISSWRNAARPTNRAWAICALTFYLIMSGLLYINWPGYFVETQWIRLAVCIPLLSLEVIYAFKRKVRERFFDSLFLLAALPVYSTSAISYLLAPPEIQTHHLLEIALIYVYCISYFRVRLIRAMIFALAAGFLGGIAVIGVGLQHEVPALRIAFELACVGGLAFTSVFASYSREFLARSNYREKMASREAQSRSEALADEALADAHAKSRFMSDAGQQLQTPTQKIVAAAMQPLPDGELPEQAGAYLDNIRESAERLERIVGQIIEIARAPADQLPTRPEPMPVLDIVRAVLDKHAPEIEAADLGVRFGYTNRAALVMADRQNSLEIVGHVLSNAIKFSPRGGTIDLSIECVSEHFLTLLVTDQGKGISQADLQRVLEPFVQVDDGLDRRHEGLGLGLTLANKLMQMNGGRLSIDPDHAPGTRVRLTFPAANFL